MKKSDDVVAKANELIEASYNLSLIEQRIILLSIIEFRRMGKPPESNEPVFLKAADYAK